MTSPKWFLAVALVATLSACADTTRERRTVTLTVDRDSIMVLDTVTFVAQGVGSGTPLGWSWQTGPGGDDPWTKPCSGANTTCRIRIHGSGTMYFRYRGATGVDSAAVSVDAGMWPDVGDEPGDAEIDTNLTLMFREPADGDTMARHYARLQVQPTDSCALRVLMTSPGASVATVSLGEVTRWIDTATAYAAAAPSRVPGQRVRYAWIPMTIGVERTITDESDKVRFIHSGVGVLMKRSEVPQLARLLDSAAAETRRLSSGRC